MAKLTAAQRKALPLDAFGDPDRRLYPVQDQGDLDAAVALIGKAKDADAVKKRLIAIAKRLDLTLPDAWKTVTMAALPMELSDTAVVGTEEGMVRRTGLITKAGDFAAHKWAITPEELKAAAERFTGPGYVELEHQTSQGKQTILTNRMGYLDAPVWTSEDGRELYGDLLLPEWINTMAEANGGKLSAVFEPSDKSIVGVGLVLDPAVPEAAMLSAFVTFAKRHDTPHGQYAMQDLHDNAVRHGATCAAGNVGMASKHEASAVQQIHDLAVEHGATCEAVSVGGTGSGERLMTYSKDEQPAGKKETPTVAEKTAQEQDGPTVAELKAQLDQAKAQQDEQRRALVALQAERRVEKADLWVDKLITDSVIMPAERPLLVKLHVMAATDDDTSGLVTLADGGKESRLATLVAAIGTRIKHGLTEEHIAANPDVVVLLNRQKAAKDEETSADDDEKLLAMTETGRRALARKRAAGAH